MIRLRLLPAVTATVLLPALLTGTVAAEGLAGLPLDQALRALQAQGLHIIFSSDLVQPDMLVESEPVAGDLQGQLEEILAPHGLAAQAGPAGTLLVVKARQQPPPGTIRGWVRSSTDHRPLPWATVRLPVVGTSTLTGSDGSFQITGVGAGIHTLQAHLAGFHAQEEEISVLAGRSSTVTFELTPLATFLREIVVTPSHFGILRDQPEPRQFMSRTETDRTPHLADDLYRAIGRLPGAARGDLSARLNLRGGDRNEIQVILDGLELVEPFHFRDFQALFSIIDSEAIGGVDVLSGGFPVEFGNRMSGVIDISSATPAAEPENALGLSFIHARLLSEGSFGQDRGRWLVSFRRGYLDLVLRWASLMAGDDDDEEERFEPVYWDMLGKVQYQLSDRTTLSGNILLSSDRVVFIEDDDPDRIIATCHSAYTWLNAKTAWSPDLFSQTVLSVGHIGRERYGNITTGDSVRDNRAYRFTGLNQRWSLELSERHFLKWGFSARQHSASYDYQASGAEIVLYTDLPHLTGPRRAGIRLAGADLGAYLADRIRLSEPLVAEVGLRWDRQTAQGESQLSPRLNLIYSRGPFSVRAAWGRFSQAQRLDEVPVEDGVSDLYSAQRGEHRLLSFEHLFRRSDLTLRAEVYHKQIANPHPRFENVFERSQYHPELRTDRVKLVPSRAEMKGIEVLLKRDSQRNPSWLLSYVLSWAEDEIDGRMMPRSWDQRHMVRFALTWLFKNGWTTTFATTYHTAWPTTRISGESVYDPVAGWIIRPDLGPINGDRMHSFQRIDVRAGRQIALRRSTLSFYIEVINLFNTKNYYDKSGFYFNFERDGTLRVLSEWDAWLPMIPSAGLNWRF